MGYALLSLVGGPVGAGTPMTGPLVVGDHDLTRLGPASHIG